MIADGPQARGAALRSQRPDWLRNRERGSTLLLRLMSMLSLRLGRPAGRVVLHAIAAYFFVFAPRARVHMRNYLRRALQREPAASDRYRLILSFASTIHDRVYLLRERFELLDITLEGEQLVAEHGAGAFLMGAHLGSFEVTRALGRSRPGVRVAMAMYEQNARKLHSVIETLNPQLTVDIIPLGMLDSMLQIRARLEAGIFVGVLGDRSFGAEHYECVDFLGAPAWFPTGAMRAAALLRRPVIFMAGIYRGANRYHILFEQLADFSATAREQREASVRLAVRRYAALLERLCRNDPYNWFNFFDFWQTPAAPAATTAAAGVTTP
jgi:predicted LPLAT superfamily acyltransferase